MRNIFILLLFGFLFACKDATTDSYEQMSGVENGILNIPLRQLKSKEIIVTTKEKRNERILYKMGLISASSFLQNKGIHLDSKGIDSIAKESVMILEISLKKHHKKILDLKLEEMTKDQLLIYFMGDIVKDIKIVQGINSYSPTGHFFEDQIKGGNNIRFYFYFKNLNLFKPYRVKLYDRLFSTGIINFMFN